jgi:hypothetical protein
MYIVMYIIYAWGAPCNSLVPESESEPKPVDEETILILRASPT